MDFRPEVMISWLLVVLLLFALIALMIPMMATIRTTPTLRYKTRKPLVAVGWMVSVATLLSIVGYVAWVIYVTNTTSGLLSTHLLTDSYVVPVGMIVATMVWGVWAMVALGRIRSLRREGRGIDSAAHEMVPLERGTLRAMQPPVIEVTPDGDAKVIHRYEEGSRHTSVVL